NRSERNLVLMCVEHANTIDEPTSLASYPVELLHAWKAKQLEEYDRIKQGWALNSEMAGRAIEASFSNAAIVIKDSTVHLGGEGGKAPGAGGGGGGAIGRAARAGRGGPGGGHRIDRGEYTLPWTEDQSMPPFLDLPLLQAAGSQFYPGAGGGGAGRIGDDAIA